MMKQELPHVQGTVHISGEPRLVNFHYTDVSGKTELVKVVDTNGVELDRENWKAKFWHLMRN